MRIRTTRELQGSPDSYTAWMPLHDCLQGQGTLEIKEMSHLFGLQHTGGTSAGKQPREAIG